MNIPPLSPGRSLPRVSPGNDATLAEPLVPRDTLEVSYPVDSPAPVAVGAADLKPCPTEVAAPGPKEAASASFQGWQVAGTSPTPVAASLPKTGYDTSFLDLSVDPKDDFFHYAVGSYLKNHPIPPSQSVGGIDAELKERVREQLKGMLESAVSDPQNEDERRLGDFYQSGMNTQSRDMAGMGPIEGLLQSITRVSNLGQLQGELARLNRQGINPLFDFGSGQDGKDQSLVTGQAFQGGLGLPDRDYYTSDDADSVALREKYRDHVERTFALVGQDPTTAARSAETVLRLETRLAETSLTKVEMREPAAIYNPMNRSQLAALSPHFDWGQYFSDLGRPDLTSINIGTPKFFGGLDRALREEPLEDWKTYFSWTVLRNTSSSLSQPFRDEDFSFQKELTGAKAAPPLWQTMVAQTDNFLGDSLGRLFVAEHFPPEARQKAEEMVGNVVGVLGERISQLDWMGPETKAEALHKLDKMRVKIGYPEQWKDYGDLKFDRHDYAGNVLVAKGFQFDEDMARIGAPVDKNRWLMSPSTVNAYYDPSNNEFVMPAGILQPPYFDLNQDDAINYGITAGTIGHEITHGFDDEGALYDADGNLRNWFSPQDKLNFEGLTDGVARQFSEFSYQGIPVNGKLVLGESVADLGGLEVAFRAFQKAREKEEPPALSPDGFTPEQRFFLGYAESWAWNVRPERARAMLLTDPHPLPEFRALGPLANMPEFLQAFSIPPGSPMYRPVELRNRLWG